MQIAMAARLLISLIVMVAGCLTFGPVAAVSQTPSESLKGTLEIDQFGGIRLPVAKPGPAFRVMQRGDRWVFVTPAGNPFWMLGVFHVDGSSSIDDTGSSYNGTVLKKYGGWQKWSTCTSLRLRNWGFNTIAEYASWYVLPPKNTNSSQMPFALMLRPAYYSLRMHPTASSGPVKDIISGTNPKIYRGWRGNTSPDVFDPQFEAYMDSAVEAVPDGVLQSPWLIGITVDDTDNLVGFGPGPEVPAKRFHPHLGWLALVTDYQQSENLKLGIAYKDPKTYSKYALIDFLRAKYRSIGALNKTWGSRYTTFDSDGGWGVGNGLLDEDGHHAWVGDDWVGLSRSSREVQRDLDEFLYKFAKRYFSVVVRSIRKRCPRQLIFGPATLNGWGGLTRKEILHAAGESVDVLQADVTTQEVMDLTAKYGGNIPIVTWTGLTANSDSPLSQFPDPDSPNGDTSYRSQAARGQAYERRLVADFNRQVSETGIKPIAGTKYWAYTDSWGEKSNWGLVSLKDNPYGLSGSGAAGSSEGICSFDSNGVEPPHGDFISSVRRTNIEILDQLEREILTNMKTNK